MISRRPHLLALLLGALLGLTIAACGPIRYDGPTAIIVKVLLNEGRGTRSLYFSGVDATPVNIFPSVYRPNPPSATQLQTGQLERILLDDSVGGTPITITVVGIDEGGIPVETGTAQVTPVARQETQLTVKLSLYETGTGGGSATGGGGGAVGGGSATGGGSAGLGGGGASGGGDGGTTPACRCDGGCCDRSGACAAIVNHVIPVGPPGQLCLGICDPVRTDRYSADAGTCVCGSTSQRSCGDGLRCTGGACRCDTTSGCAGCCSTSGLQCIGKLAQSDAGPSSGSGCGSGGNDCTSCGSETCSLGLCGSTCTPGTGKCCSGSETYSVKFPTCGNTSNICVACDTSRSDRCGGTKTGCTCADAGVCGPVEACVDGSCLPMLFFR